MNKNQVFKYIKADQFFATYLPHITSYKHKIRGKNGRGNPTEFSHKEQQEIMKALRKMLKDFNS